MTPPDLEWIPLPDEPSRLAWYRAVIAAYASLWEGHVSEARFTPADEDALVRLEQRLGCRLPAPLRRYHQEIGTLTLGERLCSIDDGHAPIEPLLDAYPGIEEMALSPEEEELAERLVAFGDYLGNGNLFCFHRDTGAVYYFDHDHDDGAILTHFADSISDYLDALMIRCLAEIHEDDDAGESLLVEKLGRPLVRKWLY